MPLADSGGGHAAPPPPPHQQHPHGQQHGQSHATSPVPWAAASQLQQLFQPSHPQSPTSGAAPLPPVQYVPPTLPAATHQILPSGVVVERQADAPEAEVEKAKSEYQRRLTARAIGGDIEGPHVEGRGVGVGEVKPMTWQEYNALDPQAKAAVDFNTMLVRATRKDLHNQDEYDPSKQQKKNYNSAVKDMFGADGGSDIFAPETMRVLEQIKFDDSSTDLDEFLNLQTAITAKDLKNLEITPPLAKPATPATQPWEAAPTEPAQVRTDLVATLASHTQEMQAALVKGNELLQTITATAAVAGNSFLTGPTGFGGIANDPKMMAGFEPGVFKDGVAQDENAYFQTAFDSLANKGLNFDQTLSNVSADLAAHPGAMERFMSYANVRSGNARRFDVSLGDAPGVHYRSPEQYRKLLGLGE